MHKNFYMFFNIYVTNPSPFCPPFKIIKIRKIVLFQCNLIIESKNNHKRIINKYF